MKAEDINKLCPMAEAEKLECVFKSSLNEYRQPWGIFDKTRRLSAEISFKAGYKQHKEESAKALEILEKEIKDKLEEVRQEGIKEAVDFFLGHSDDYDHWRPVYHFRVSSKALQAKRKEWGVE